MSDEERRRAERDGDHGRALAVALREGRAPWTRSLVRHALENGAVALREELVLGGWSVGRAPRHEGAHFEVTNVFTGRRLCRRPTEAEAKEVVEDIEARFGPLEGSPADFPAKVVDYLRALSTSPNGAIRTAPVPEPADDEVTRAVALSFRVGDVVHHRSLKNADGTPLRARVNGKVKTWRRRPLAFRVPMKHGLRDCFYLDNANCGEWRVS